MVLGTGECPDPGEGSEPQGQRRPVCNDAMTIDDDDTMDGSYQEFHVSGRDNAQTGRFVEEALGDLRPLDWVEVVVGMGEKQWIE